MSAVPAVSVVVPVYNREILLPQALESVAAQTCGDIECIVTDNASTDGTLDVARRFAGRDSRFRVLSHSSNAGPVINWRRGVEAARAPWVKILFSDDWLEPRCLEAMTEALERFPAAGFVYARCAIDGRRLPPARPSGEEAGTTFLWRSLLPGDARPVSPCAGLFRREDVLRALHLPLPSSGGFDFMGTGAGVDQSIFLLAAVRRSAVYLDETLVHFRAHPDSITVREAARRRGYLRSGYLAAQLNVLRSPDAAGVPGVLLMRGFVRLRMAFLACGRMAWGLWVRLRGGL